MIIVLLREPFSILEVVPRVMEIECIGHYHVVRVSEVDVTHIFGIVVEIGIQSVVVPEVMEVVLSKEIMPSQHDKEVTSEFIAHPSGNKRSDCKPKQVRTRKRTNKRT